MFFISTWLFSLWPFLFSFFFGSELHPCSSFHFPICLNGFPHPTPDLVTSIPFLNHQSWSGPNWCHSAERLREVWTEVEVCLKQTLSLKSNIDSVAWDLEPFIFFYLSCYFSSIFWSLSLLCILLTHLRAFLLRTLTHFIAKIVFGRISDFKAWVVPKSQSHMPSASWSVSWSKTGCFHLLNAMVIKWKCSGIR